MEEATLAVGGRETNQAAGRDGQHETHGAMEIVGDLGGFVDDQQPDMGVAADRFLLAGQADNAAVIGQLKLGGGLTLQHGGAEAAIELGDDAE